MKLLMFYAPSFWSQTHEKVLPEAPEAPAELSADNAVVVFYQAEAADAGREPQVLAKLVKNVKWLAGKFDTRSVVLHSFGHLSASKAPPELAQAIAGQAARRLEGAGYTVQATPFGHLNQWKLHVAGPSLAKVFKEI